MYSVSTFNGHMCIIYTQFLEMYIKQILKVNGLQKLKSLKLLYLKNKVHFD